MSSYCFDLDGTLCTNSDGKYELAQPFTDRIDRVNVLFDSGNQIIIFTARGSTTGIDWRVVTEKQLIEWNVKYHQLLFGKPFADFYIDDKAQTDSEFFKKVIL